MPFYIKPHRDNPYQRSYADHRDIRLHFGIKGDKLPLDFEGMTIVHLRDGRQTDVHCFASSSDGKGDWRTKTSKHRCFAVCPDCRDFVPAGRTRQHKCRKSGLE